MKNIKLVNLGFKPITKEVLKNYSTLEIEKCENIIINEIKITTGDTDPDIISKKYYLSLNLVSRMFWQTLPRWYNWWGRNG